MKHLKLVSFVPERTFVDIKEWTCWCIIKFQWRKYKYIIYLFDSLVLWNIFNFRCDTTVYWCITITQLNFNMVRVCNENTNKSYNVAVQWCLLSSNIIHKLLYQGNLFTILKCNPIMYCIKICWKMVCMSSSHAKDHHQDINLYR